HVWLSIVAPGRALRRPGPWRLMASREPLPWSGSAGGEVQGLCRILMPARHHPTSAAGYPARMAESVPDLDLRLVRYFTVVAEHGHFGRAAEALHITQPSLSRQIRGLERLLGATLFDRTPHGTRLTEAGEVFLPRARALLRSSAQAVAATRAAAGPSRLVIGHTLN